MRYRLKLEPTKGLNFLESKKAQVKMISAQSSSRPSKKNQPNLPHNRGGTSSKIFFSKSVSHTHGCRGEVNLPDEHKCNNSQ